MPARPGLTTPLALQSSWAPRKQTNKHQHITHLHYQLRVSTESRTRRSTTSLKDSTAIYTRNTGATANASRRKAARRANLDLVVFAHVIIQAGNHVFSVGAVPIDCTSADVFRLHGRKSWSRRIRCKAWPRCSRFFRGCLSRRKRLTLNLFHRQLICNTRQDEHFRSP
jgi:hypothetical protein